MGSDGKEKGCDAHSVSDVYTPTDGDGATVVHIVMPAIPVHGATCADSRILVPCDELALNNQSGTANVLKSIGWPL